MLGTVIEQQTAVRREIYSGDDTKLAGKRLQTEGETDAALVRKLMHTCRMMAPRPASRTMNSIGLYPNSEPA